MNDQKEENVYEEARRTVKELNEILISLPGVSIEREFTYAEGSLDCGISLGNIVLWTSGNDERLIKEEKDELESLRSCIVRQVNDLAKTLTKIAKGIKS